VQTAVDGALAVNGLRVLPPSMAAKSSSPARNATAGDWGATSRDVQLGAGAPAILATTENFNAGWQASFGGQRLQAVRVDGWRQGWLVPAGSGGIVHLSYAPDTTYFAGLLVGIGGVLLLLFVAVAGRRRDDELGPAGPTAKAPWWAPVAVVLAGFVVAGPVGVLVAAVALWWCPDAWRWRVAVGAFGLAGAIVAFDPGRFPRSGHGSFSRPVQLLACVAFVFVASALADGLGPAFAHRERRGPVTLLRSYLGRAR
jgi:arabinofuranan 3-O-arabinosyltransferase